MMRLDWLDRLRGLAIVLMVLDHTLLVIDPSFTHPLVVALRLTVTRLALPCFMIVSGYLWALRAEGSSWRSTWRVSVGALLCAPLATIVGIVVPEILLMYLLALMFRPFAVRWPLAFVVVGFLQALYVPIMGPGIYELGLVLAWISLGAMLPATVAGDRLARWSNDLPAWLASVGRRPLTWYCTHLAVLAAGVVAARWLAWH